MSSSLSKGIGEKPSWFTSWKLVSPETAQYVLDNWNSPNRILKQNNLIKIRKSIRKNGWRSLDPIHVVGEFGKSRLLNGQHRLTLLVETGTSQWVQVTEYAPKEAFDFIDTASVRSTRDAISIWAAERGIQVPNLDDVTALVRLRVAYLKLGPRSLTRSDTSLSNSEAVEEFAKWQDCISYVTRGRALSKKMGAGCSVSTCGLVLWLLDQHHDPDFVRQFEADLKAGGYDEGSALRAVADAFSEIRELGESGISSKQQLASRHKQAWILLMGWVKWAQSLPSSRLSYNTRGGDIPQLPGIPQWKEGAV